MIAPFIGIRVTYASRFPLSVRARSSAGCIFSLTELPHGEIETIDRLGLPVRIVLQEQLGKLQSGEGYLGAEPQTGGHIQGLVVVSPSLLGPTEEGRGSAEVARGAREAAERTGHMHATIRTSTQKKLRCLTMADEDRCLNDTMSKEAAVSSSESSKLEREAISSSRAATASASLCALAKRRGSGGNFAKSISRPSSSNLPVWARAVGAKLISTVTPYVGNPSSSPRASSLAFCSPILKNHFEGRVYS